MFVNLSPHKELLLDSVLWGVYIFRGCKKGKMGIVSLEQYKEFYYIEDIQNVIQAEMVLEAYSDFIKQQLKNHYGQSYEELIEKGKISQVIAVIIICENVKKILKSMEDKEVLLSEDYGQFSHSIGDQSFSFSSIISSFTLSSAHKKMLGITGLVTRRIRL